VKVSELARPPIQSHEIKDVETAICRNHKGLISGAVEREGSVWFCPIGKEFWRYSKQQNGFNTPLRYPKSGVI
jgi:hypothetical protein